MKSQTTRWLLALAMVAILATTGCSTTGNYTENLGATEQRLVTQRIDRVADMLPSDDFEPLRGRSLFVKSHFIRDDQRLTYATERLKLALISRFGIKLVDSPAQADKSLHVFFNALASDKDELGLKTPDVVIPGFAGTIGIDIITLDMFHGVAELHYFLLDANQQLVKQSDKLRATVRTDRLNFPFISIPINTLD
jgi:hypothetical protein